MEANVDHAMMGGLLQTVFGWQIRASGVVNPRSLLDWPLQANGSEMTRPACIYGTEVGIEICFPVHYAVLICAPIGRIDADVELMRACMMKASSDVLGGFTLKIEGEPIVYPDRYMDAKRGAKMWEIVIKQIALAEARAEVVTARRLTA
jgi:hypothetical protein